MIQRIKSNISLKKTSAFLGLLLLILAATNSPLSAQSALANDVYAQTSKLDVQQSSQSVVMASSHTEIIATTSVNTDQSSSSMLPQFLKNMSEDIAGKPVSTVRVYASLAILLFAASLAVMLLYSGIKVSIASINRNPLSKKPIVKSVFQIIVTSIIIFLIGVFAVYLILRL